MEFKEELSKLLQQLNLPDARIELETTSAGKVGGFIISSRFEGMSQLDRQDLIWNHLDGLLPKDKQRQIVALLTLTPAEADDAA